ncbi:MAG: glycoside hydrolase [Chloroflexota bacterium]|nr:glycoside hydrolase [Chloroflexota bacterium]
MRRPILVLTMAVAAMLFPLIGSPALASSPIAQISTDPFSNPTPGQHHTEVEPDIFSYGGTVVSTFQEGRFFDGGSTDPGWATLSGGKLRHGPLPGLTVYSKPAGPYARASDPAVAYDAKHGTWLISTLAINSNVVGVAVAVNRSPDGITWSNPVTAAAAHNSSDFFDKEWIVCDNTATSPFYGHCYVEYDNAGIGDVPFMTTSTDGGKTWSTPISPTGGMTGLGGQPLAQPSGTVIVPFEGDFGTISAYRSTDGGQSWGNEVVVAPIQAHGEDGNLRSGPLPSAEVDKNGTVYVTWGDCRFEASCSANDIVMSTSADGITWSAVKRIPINPVGSGVDHFIPGIGVDRTTGGSTAHLALTYYYYPQTNCGNSCQLDVGYITSTNGGATWSAPAQLAGPMSLSWLAQTNSGPMVGDYIATTILSGTAYPAFVVAQAPSGSTLNEATYSARLGVTGGSIRTSENEPAVGVGPVNPGHGPLTAF